MSILKMTKKTSVARRRRRNCHQLSFLNGWIYKFLVGLNWKISSCSFHTSYSFFFYIRNGWVRRVFVQTGDWGNNLQSGKCHFFQMQFFFLSSLISKRKELGRCGLRHWKEDSLFFPMLTYFLPFAQEKPSNELWCLRRYFPPRWYFMLKRPKNPVL